MGSGTTAVASQNNNRNYIGFEVDEKYYAQSEQRLMYTQNKLKYKIYKNQSIQ